MIKIEIIHTGWSKKDPNMKQKEYIRFIDILNKNDIDAVINPTNNNLEEFIGENSNIYKWAGDDFLESCKTEAPVSEVAIISNPHKLNVKKIIHLIGPEINQNNKLEHFNKAFQSCLKLSENNGFEKILFPIIGFSPYEIDKHIIAENIISIVQSYSEKQDVIKKILFLTHSHFLYNLYTTLSILDKKQISFFLEFAQERNEKSKKIQNSLLRSMTKEEKLMKKLNKQKNEIEEKNDELNQLLEEVAVQNEALEKQKDTLQSQKDEIIDSITYAKRIQKAILPTDKYIKELLVVPTEQC